MRQMRAGMSLRLTKVFLGGGVTLLAICLMLAHPTTIAAQGLKLDQATDKTMETYDKPNPHFDLACSECHTGTPDLKKDTWATVKFVNGEEGNVKLCYSCHDASDNLHPINVDPTKATPAVKIPPDFPLERIGAAKGTIVCSTCHFIHAKTAGLKLLRGFPESSDPEEIGKAKFKDRRDLCRSCHGEGLAKKSPHKGKDTEDKKSCSFCHATEPKEGEPVKFTKSLVQLCDFCHAATKGAHFLLVNPFADPNLKDEIAKAKVPMIGGEYNCVSCHNPHGGTGEEKFLRKEFVQLALKSLRVRPHYMKAFCESCHTVRPKVAKGAPGAQPLSEIPLREADPNKLCNRCHESGLSKSNAHPMKAVPDLYKGRIPKEWPLAGGALTCLTCHTAGDSVTLDPANPSFLRGGPYATRNAVCWTCHLKEEFAAINPHDLVQQMQGCEFCHATKPDLNKTKSIEDVSFKGDIVLLCLRCHDESPHPGNADHAVLPRKDFMEAKKISIPKDFPLDSKGRVTCASCHNPHSYGAKRGTMEGMEMCALCHQNQ